MWNEGKSLVIITGASRGLGQAIAIQMARQCENPHVVLISRPENDLKNTETQCIAQNSKCQITVHVADMLTASKQDFETMLEPLDVGIYDSIVVVHNAGSLGNQGTKVTDFDDLQEMQDYFRLNVFSVMLLNSVIVKKVGDKIKNKLVINISSLAALQPFETWGSYCSGKAARDSLFKVMAAEEPTWTVLNYAPGPLDTKMIQDILDDSATHENIKSAFENLKSSNGLLQPETSAKGLIQLLNSGAFKSGAHVDYFDIIS